MFVKFINTEQSNRMSVWQDLKRGMLFFGSVYFALSTVPSKNYPLPRSPKDYQLSLVAICSTCNSLDREQKVRTRNTLYPRTFNHCK